MKKATNFVKTCWTKSKKAVVGVGSAVSIAVFSALPAYAAEASTTINTNATTESVIGGILDVIFKIALYIGIVLAVIGVVQFILAFKDDNAEQQSRGIRLAVIGTALIGVKVLIQLTGLIS